MKQINSPGYLFPVPHLTLAR